MSQRSHRLFLVLLVAMALAAAGLILSIPPLFGLHEPSQMWLTVGLGGVTAVLAAAVVLVRPSGPKVTR